MNTKKKVKAKKETKYKSYDDEYWLKRVQNLINKHSSEPRKSGKYKGHGSTDTALWIRDLEKEVTKHIKAAHKGRIDYDENMATARLLGRVLVVWYCTVLRSKSFDPNRPIERKRASVAVTQYRGELMSAISDDELMGKVFGDCQYWNFPFGKGAFGGNFK